MDHLQNFVCIGAGRVAGHLVKELCNNGFKLLQVYNRTSDSARDMALDFNADYTSSVAEITPDADFYLVSISDQALQGFLAELPVREKLIVHTAGSYGTEVFGDKFSSFGVFYPLQTFTKNVSLNFSEIPFLIEGNNPETLSKIESIALKLSNRVIVSDAESRRKIHLAAIFASNFSNHMVALSSEILENENIDPSILQPLIDETFRKIKTMKAETAQTGPAVRNDVQTIEKHLKMLENQPLLQKIYNFTSISIQDLKKRNKHS